MELLTAIPLFAFGIIVGMFIDRNKASEVAKATEEKGKKVAKKIKQLTTKSINTFKA